MIWVTKKRRVDQVQESAKNDTVVASVSVTLSQVKQAIREFERQLPEGINRTVLVGQENEIDFRLLIPYLHGLPDRKFYMSRESFEVFGEEDRMIPYWLDIVQRAVDDYVDEQKITPLIPGNRNRRISYPILIKRYYLKESPPVQFYLTHYENLISHRPLERS